MITLTYKYISFITLLVLAFTLSAVTVSADVAPEQSRASITRSTDRDHDASRDHAGRGEEASEEDEDSNSSSTDGNNGNSGEEGIILTVERNSNGEIVITYSGNTGGSGANITVTVDGEVIAEEGGQQQGGSGDGVDGQDGADGSDGSNDDKENELEEEEEEMSEDDEDTVYRVERPERNDRGSRR